MCTVPLVSRAICLNKAGILTELLGHIAENPGKNLSSYAIMRAFNAGVTKLGHFKIQRTLTPQRLAESNNQDEFKNPAMDVTLAIYKCIHMHCSLQRSAPGSQLPCRDGYVIKADTSVVGEAAEAEDLHLQPPFIEAPLPQSYQSVAGMDGPSTSILRIAFYLNVDEAYIRDSDYVVSSWKYYCSLHGYTFIVDHTRYPELDGNATRHIANTRIAGSLQVLDRFDYVVQIALDTVVVNRSFRIESFLDGLPDIVIPLRTHKWQSLRSWHTDAMDGEINRVWPLSNFSERPVKLENSPMLHTEVIIIKNSAHGRAFCWELLKNADLHYAYDMAAIQKVAMEFIHPETASVKVIKQFSTNLTQGFCSDLTHVLGPNGYFGYRGLWCPDENSLGMALNLPREMYYRLTSVELAKQRDWYNANGGHLRISQEGELLRDWTVGKLMLGGDFILHTKNFATKGKLRDQLGDSCKSDGSVQLVTNPDLFADAKASKYIAWAGGYNANMVFLKSNCFNCNDVDLSLDLGGELDIMATSGENFRNLRNLRLTLEMDNHQ
jgi:hypothetical protein